LQYTSGSTSDPKGVMLSHAHLLWNIRALAERGRATAHDRWVTWLPPYHDMGLIGAIFLPLAAGTEVPLLSPSPFLQQPYRWLSAPWESRTRFGPSTPRRWGEAGPSPPSPAASRARS